MLLFVLIPVDLQLVLLAVKSDGTTSALMMLCPRGLTAFLLVFGCDSVAMFGSDYVATVYGFDIAANVYFDFVGTVYSWGFVPDYYAVSPSIRFHDGPAYCSTNIGPSFAGYYPVDVVVLNATGCSQIVYGGSPGDYVRSHVCSHVMNPLVFLPVNGSCNKESHDDAYLSICCGCCTEGTHVVLGPYSWIYPTTCPSLSLILMP